MTGKTNSEDSKKKSFKLRKSLLKATKVRAAMSRFMRSLKLKKKESEVPVESLENLRTQMLSVSNNDVLNLESTMTETHQSMYNVPTEALENRLTQMLSASNNDLLNLESTMTGALLLTPRAQMYLLGL